MKTTRKKESACKGRTALALATAACLALAAASCKKDDRSEPAHSGEAVFTASTETQVGEGKTHMDGNKDVLWNNNDEIVVFDDKGDSHHFKADGNNTTSTSFAGVGEVPEDFYLSNKFQAYYPAGCVNESDRTVTLPRFQVYQEGGFASGYNPMVALSSGTNLQFRNLCGLLELRLTGSSNVAAIHVKSLTEGEYLCGTGTVEWGDAENEYDPGHGSYEVPMLNFKNGHNIVSLVCASSSNPNGVELTSNATSFYIVVPAGTLEGSFSVEVVSSDHMSYGRLVSPGDAGHDIVRSRIRPMTQMPISLNVPEVDGTLYGEFSVGLNKTVRFSRGNLTYNTDGTWSFCENQTDRVEHSEVSENYGYVEGGTKQRVSLFGWGTSGKQHGTVHWQPWSTAVVSSPSESDNYWAYGGVTKNLYDGKDEPTEGGGESWDPMTGQADWGFNKITNGGDQEDLWRTPKSNEWDYLVTDRGQEEGWKKFAKVSVKDSNGTNINGLLVFPDGTITNDNTICGVKINNIDAKGYVRFQSISNWCELEAAGCVFLPCAGYRDGTSVNSTDMFCEYWTSTIFNNDYINYMGVYEGGVEVAHGIGKRYYGFSVRLVRDVK